MDIANNEIVKNVLSKFTESLMNKIGKISQSEWEKFKIDFDFVFTKYIEKSYEKYNKIKTILYKTEPKYIYDFFEAPSIQKKFNVRIGTEDIDNVLDISNFIIIEGTGGIGKSTLLKHFFINELEKKDLIPVFIELKDINLIDEDYSIIDMIFNKLCDLGSTIKKEYIEYALESGCFLFLLDGYDEIVSNKKDSFFRKLDSFCDKYTENYFIISSRPYSEFVEFQRFTIVEALPLSKEQAVSLVSKIDYDNGIKERFVNELNNRLYDKHKSFASNPLLLNIMLLTFDNYADIPEKLHLFYSNAFETLYLKHDANKSGYKREMLSGLAYDSFKLVFSYFCFMTYLKGMTEFTYDELQDILKKIRIPRVDFEVEMYIFDLVNSLCLLYKDGFNYIFAHRSFQEYFTAFFLKELSDANLQKYALKMIKSEASRASYDNVFSMLYDMMEERFEKNILLPVIQEYEEAIPESVDKYEYYFKDLVHTIRYDNGEEEDELRLWLRREDAKVRDNNMIEFIYTFMRKCKSGMDGEGGGVTISAEKELFEYLLNEKGYSFNSQINMIDLEDDVKVFELMKKTWIGASVKRMVQLKQYLLDKHEKNESALESMLSFDDMF